MPDYVPRFVLNGDYPANNPVNSIGAAETEAARLRRRRGPAPIAMPRVIQSASPGDTSMEQASPYWKPPSPPARPPSNLAVPARGPRLPAPTLAYLPPQPPQRPTDGQDGISDLLAGSFGQSPLGRLFGALSGRPSEDAGPLSLLLGRIFSPNGSPANLEAPKIGLGNFLPGLGQGPRGTVEERKRRRRNPAKSISSMSRVTRGNPTRHRG
jgi:hypothetical protein